MLWWPPSFICRVVKTISWDSTNIHFYLEWNGIHLILLFCKHLTMWNVLFFSSFNIYFIQFENTPFLLHKHLRKSVSIFKIKSVLQIINTSVVEKMQLRKAKLIFQFLWKSRKIHDLGKTLKSSIIKRKKIWFLLLFYLLFRSFHTNIQIQNMFALMLEQI